MAQYLTNALVLGSIYVLAALGLTLTWGVLNILNLAHGAILMMGGLFAYVITKDSDVPFVVVILACMVGCGTISVLAERLVYRQIRRRVSEHDAELTTMIAAIGVTAVLVAIGLKVFNSSAVSMPPTVFNVHDVTVLGQKITNLGIAVVIIALSLGGILVWFIRSTQTGRAMRGLAYDTYTCGLLGVSTNRIAMGTMFVGGAIAGIAGLAVGLQYNAVDAAMGDSLLLKAFAVIILGGVGSVGGAMLGAYLLAFAEVLFGAYVSVSFTDAIGFGLIIVLLLLRPQGLFSRGAWQRA